MSSAPAAPAAAAPATPGLAAAGKYMTFQLAGEVYGLEILKVREIIGLLEVTRVPCVAPCIRGVINLRGKVIPVIDLRLRFGLEPCPESEQSVIVVVQHEVGERTLTMGVLVDRVLEVLSIDAAELEPPPPLSKAAGEGRLLVGVGKAASGIVFLLDVDEVLHGHAAAEA